MRRACLLILAGPFLQCGGEPPAPAPQFAGETTGQAPAQGGEATAPAQDGEATAPALVMGMAISGMDLWMDDTSPTAGALRKPTIWVHADEAVMSEDAKAWSLVGARAVIYRNEEEDLKLKADRGRFDETNGIAQLSGGVEINAGKMVMKLSSIEWDNEARRAWSDSPVTVSSGTTELQASSLVLIPDEGVFVLSDVTGRIDFQEGRL